MISVSSFTLTARSFTSLQRQNSFRRGEYSCHPQARKAELGTAAIDAWKSPAVMATIERESIPLFVKTTATKMV